ncbi:MAG: hypothetical protein ACRDV0_07745 [Acidimicrobiales bacterium]
MDDSPQVEVPDFVDKALGAMDHALDVVHDRLLRPLIVAGRAVAFGLVILLATLVLVIVTIIGVTRVANVYLFAGHEWITYGALGTIFVAVGLVIWRRRRPAAEA